MGSVLVARHGGTDAAGANSTIEYLWEYEPRKLPCTQNAIDCLYQDICYWSHDMSMTFTFIMWGVILGLELVFLFFRGRSRTTQHDRSNSFLDKAVNRFQSLKRRQLMQDSPLKSLFPRTSRLQVVVLSIILAYLLVFSLVGVVYKTWVDVPAPAYPKIKTRTGFGPWCNRVATLAFALTLFTIPLASRESLLSLVTGIPYQHFNFLHRWIGRVIYIQAALHASGWTLIEARLYRPQPLVYRTFMAQRYVIFGVVALSILSLLFILSLRSVIKRTGYEIFKASHTVLAILYLGACWGHWDRLWCWIVAGLALIALDYAVRFLRLFYLHFSPSAKHSLELMAATATVTLFKNGEETDDVALRLDFDHFHRDPWQPGQHFFLTFPSLSIWQAHPLTPSSISVSSKNTTQHHTYVIRVRNGITAKLAALGDGATLPVILTGPHGYSHSYEVEERNRLLISGGTGVSFTWPMLAESLRRQTLASSDTVRAGSTEFIWMVRRAQDLLWMAGELQQVKAAVSLSEHMLVKLNIFVTRESKTSSLTSETDGTERSNGTEDRNDTEKSNDIVDREVRPLPAKLEQILCSSPSFQVTSLDSHHPDLTALVQDFSSRLEDLDADSPGLQFLGSGPPAMDSDFRLAVSRLRCKTSRIDAHFDSR